MKRSNPTIDEAVPSYIKRIKGTDGAPCPRMFAKGYENAVIYHPPSKSECTHINHVAFLAEVRKYLRNGLSPNDLNKPNIIEHQWNRTELGFPLPNVDEPAVDTLIDLKRRKWNTDSMPIFLQKILAEPLKKNPSNFEEKKKALANPMMRQCQGLWCPGSRKEVNGLWHFCEVCKRRYTFKIPGGSGRKLWELARLVEQIPQDDEEQRQLVKSLSAMKELTYEAIVGYAVVSAAESVHFKVTGKIRMDVLEAIGKMMLCMPWVFKIALHYEVQRMIKPYRPDLALMNRYKPIKSNNQTLFKTIFERGFASNSSRRFKKSAWITYAEKRFLADTKVSDVLPSFIKTQKYIYISGLLYLLAAIEGNHPVVELRVNVTLSSENGSPDSLIHSVTDNCLEIKNAHKESFQSVWLAVERLINKNASRKLPREKIIVLMNVTGNPFVHEGYEPKGEEWNAVKDAAVACIPKTTSSFFQWIIRLRAQNVMKHANFTHVALYPLPKAEIDAVMDCVEKKKWPDIKGYNEYDASTAARKCFAVDEPADIEINTVLHVGKNEL